jgi:mRNA interferase RelE/StbE
MKVSVWKSFEKDTLRITDRKLATQLGAVINKLESCHSLAEIPNLKKMQAKGSYYRIRIGQHRLGFRLDGSDAVVLLRFMHRKDIYKNFP